MKFLRSNVSLLLVEQASNTGWNFILGMLVARWAGVEIFGVFAIILTVYFVLSSALSSMTAGIISVDVARLKQSRHKYLNYARRSAELLAIPVILMGMLIIAVVSWTSPGENHPGVALMGMLYLGANILCDIRRRVLAFTQHTGFLAYAGMIRVLSLSVWGEYAWLRFTGNERVICLTMGALAISLVYVVILTVPLPAKEKRHLRLPAITLSRQLRIGGWLFASSLATSALEQGLMMYSGVRGTPAIAGGLRAGAYLFGLLGPLLQLLDLLLPAAAHRLLGPLPRLPKKLIFVACGSVSGAVVCAAIAWINASFWLPFLGPGYMAFGFVSSWYGVMMSCFVARMFMMPFLKTKAPRAILGANLAGTLLGFILVLFAPHFTLLVLCHAIVSSVVLSMTLNLVTLFLIRT